MTGSCVYVDEVEGGGDGGGGNVRFVLQYDSKRKKTDLGIDCAWATEILTICVYC